MSEQGYMTALSDYHPGYGHSGRDFIDRYSQAPAYKSQHPIDPRPHVQPPPALDSLDWCKAPPYAAHPSAQYTHGNSKQPPRRVEHLADPAAPQYRVPDARADRGSKPQVDASKVDTPSGGVATHLDYDIESMANFVAEMAQAL